MKTHEHATPGQEAFAERNLCAVIAALRAPDEVCAFFRDLCTPTEIQAMADRWAVAELLHQNIPYREIHRLTDVSVATIGRVARFLRSGNGGYTTAYRRLQEARQARAEVSCG